MRWLSLLVVSAGLSLASVLSIDAGWLPLVSVLLAYPAGRRIASLSRAVWVFTIVAAAGLVLAFWGATVPVERWLGMALVEFLASVLPWWAGRYRRLQAEQREREHRIVAEQARLRERARIAQDMHDSLGHELALIALHGGALELADGLTDEQRRTTAELRARAVQATAKLHEIVRVLGSSDAAAGHLPADESVTDLVRRAAAAGLPVRLRQDGPPPDWSPMTGQAAHRVVRESLTNAARHAPGAAVTVTVSPTRIEVANAAGPAPGRPGSGLGLIGLQERLRLAGGRLDAGPRPGGGWAVTADLPGGPGPVVPEMPSPEPPGPEIAVSRRLTRRRLLQTAALPAGVVLALFAAIVVAQVLALRHTGLPQDRYERMWLGQPQAQIEPLLPPREIQPGFVVRAEPPPPIGADCRYYQADTGLFSFEPLLYRLCFAGTVLVTKDQLERV